MNILFNNKDGSPAYMLAKRDPGFELLRWQDGGKEITKGRHAGSLTKEGYKKMASGNGLYPSTIGYAVQLIAEDQILNSDTTVDIVQARKQVTQLMNDLDIVAEKALLVS